MNRYRIRRRIKKNNDWCRSEQLPPPSTVLTFSLRLPPGDLLLLSKTVRLTEGQRVVLNTDILLASDSAGRPEELVYAVSVPPRRGLVHAVQQPGVPLSTFTQLDVAAHRVCYTHDNSHHAETDSFR